MIANTLQEVSELGRVHMPASDVVRKHIADYNDNIAAIKRDDVKRTEAFKVARKNLVFDETIVSLVKENYARSCDLALPVVDDTSRWKMWAKSMKDNLATMKSCNDIILFAQRNLPFDHREKPCFEKVGPLRSLSFYEFEHIGDVVRGAEESKFSDPETVMFIDGKNVSNILYWHLRSFLFCSTFIPAPKDVFEIGGGYGGCARVWMLNSPQLERYIIADLPEALIFSETFLRCEFGNDAVGYWHGDDPGTKIVLLPIQRIGEYKRQSDLLINQGSMQEMSDTWVTFYMEWLKERGTRYFYSLNYMGQPLAKMGESRAFWAPRPSDEWTATIINGDVPLVDVMCINRDFCETLYEKKPSRRHFSDWSVSNGMALTRATYLEGLELLRQEMNFTNMTIFLETVVNKQKTFLIPKEIFYISDLMCSFLKERDIVGQSNNLRGELARMIGQFSQ